MGRASRRKREAREMRPLPPSGNVLGWKVYAKVLRVLAGLPAAKKDSQIIQLVKHAHVIYVDPIQAAAAPLPDTFSADRLPFPVVLLATGEASGDHGSPPYAVLMVDYGYYSEATEDEQELVLLVPIYGARFLLSLAGTATLRHGQFEANENSRPGAETALACLELLRSVNVDLAPLQSAPAAHQAAGVPMSEIVVRQRHAGHQSSAASSPVDWSHRWEVRGHYKHFTKGPIFDANPDRHIEHDGVECVRLWCPPFVKGPEDKPLVPKVRRVSRVIGFPTLTE